MTAHFTFRPLQMPWGQPVTQKRRAAPFQAGWQDTIYKLDSELIKLRAHDRVIEADFTESDIRLDGLPRKTAKRPKFPGVRIAFDSPLVGPQIYATDVCERWEDNIRSIALGLEALRAVDRHGISVMNQQYTGFKAIGGSSTSSGLTPDLARQWLASFVDGGALGLTDAQLLKKAAMRCHPDQGGTTETWARWEEAKRVLAG